MTEVSKLPDVKEHLYTLLENAKKPVDSVVGNAELIMREETNSKIRNSAYDISVSARQIGRYTDNIKDLLSIYEGALTLNEEEYEVEEVILYLRSLLEEKTARTGARFTIDVDKKIPVRLYGDVGRITEILGRFLENAALVSGAGRIRFSVVSLAKKEDRVYLRFDVSDSGSSSMSDELTTTLLVARSIAEKLSGKLAVRLLEGEGNDISWLIVQKAVGTELLEERATDLDYATNLIDIEEAAEKLLSDSSPNHGEAVRDFIENAATKADLAAYYINNRDYRNCVKLLRNLSLLAERVGAGNIVEKSLELENAAKYGCFDIAQTRVQELTNYIMRLVAELKKRRSITPEKTVLAKIDRENLLDLLEKIGKNLEEYKLEQVEEQYFLLAQMNSANEEVAELLRKGEELLLDMDVPGLKKILAEVKNKIERYGE